MLYGVSTLKLRSCFGLYTQMWFYCELFLELELVISQRIRKYTTNILSYKTHSSESIQCKHPSPHTSTTPNVIGDLSSV